jgi:dienelactone hydrolase
VKSSTCLAVSLIVVNPFFSNAQEPSAGGRWLRSLAPVPALLAPVSPEAWISQRAQIRQTLQTLLGEIPPRPAARPVLLWREDRGTYWLEKFEFDNGAAEAVRGYLFLPKQAAPDRKVPGVLYCHWHGGQYDIGKDELLGTNATPVPPGPALAEQGFAVLGIDACGFGERNGAGPDGSSQRGNPGELSAAKFNLWAGRTLWGMILRDDLSALDILASRSEVDGTRIGVTGISMGSTRTWWLMALDDRPKTGVAVGCMTRYRELIETGMLKAHGIYYFVPGMLRHFDSEAVIACAAPRPMLFMTGDSDGGSPVEGIHAITRAVEPVYAALGAKEAFLSQIEPNTGHVYLPGMWERTVAWLKKQLAP